MASRNCDNDDDDAQQEQQQQQRSSSQSESNDEVFSTLFCDALPLSTTVELNLVDCLMGSSTMYSGTTTITFQIEEPSTCLFFHANNSRVKIEKLQLHQGKHVLRPKCIFEMDSFNNNGDADAAATTASKQKMAGNNNGRSMLLFEWHDKKGLQSVALGSESKLLSCLAVADLKVVELPSPMSYCTVDIVISFQSSLSEDGNGIYCCSSRPAVATPFANGMNLTSPAFLIATQFEVDHAHKSFPCIDFVFIRQLVKFVLLVPPNTFCRSNGGGGNAEELSTQSSRNALFNSVSTSKCASSAAGASKGVNSSSSITTQQFPFKKESLPPSVRPIPFYIAGFIASTIPLVSTFQTVTLPLLQLLHHHEETKESNDNATGDYYEDVPEETIEFCVVTTYDSPFMTEIALKSLIDSTKELRQFFHCPLELPHLWMFAAPKLVLGGMENDGFIFLKESIGVTNHSQPGQGRRSTEAATKELVRFVVHEVVHHWVGNRIGFSFAWKEGITLVLERYYGNILLGLNPNQGSKGGASTMESESATESGKLVQVESGKELSGTTYHKAESAMEAVVRKLGWKVFQSGVQRMIHHLTVGEYIDDGCISSYFKLSKRKNLET